MDITKKSCSESAGDDVIGECRRIARAWAPALHALAHEDRLLIALWLAEQPRTVRELESATGLRQSLVSYHLNALRHAGIVAATAEGRRNRYRLCSSDLSDLVAVMERLHPEPAAEPHDRPR